MCFHKENPQVLHKGFCLGLMSSKYIPIVILYCDSFFNYVQEKETDLSEMSTNSSIHISTYSSCNWKTDFKRQYQTVSIGLSRHVTGVRKNRSVGISALQTNETYCCCFKTSEVKTCTILQRCVSSCDICI